MIVKVNDETFVKANIGNTFVKANGDTFIKLDKDRRSSGFTSELSPDPNNDNNIKMRIDEYGEVYFNNVLFIPAKILNKVGFYASLGFFRGFKDNPKDRALNLYIALGDHRKDLDFNGNDGWLDHREVEQAHSFYTLKELFSMVIETAQEDHESVKKLREEIINTFDEVLKECEKTI